MTTPHLSRRNLLAGGLAAALASRWSPAGAAQKARARACIVLWLNGGPSHIDTFDPKKGANARFKAIKTRASGVELSEHLPLLADQAHHLAVVRSLTGVEGNHDRARYALHTGYAPNPTVRHPSLGGWVSHELGAAGLDLPSFVSIGGPSVGPGFLGLQHAPFIVDDPSTPPRNVERPAAVNAARFAQRRSALATLEAHFLEASGQAPQVMGRRAVDDQAVRMMQSSRLGAFAVSEEPEATRKLYGETPFGRGCLAARRLVQAGVKLVEVVLDGWDTHKDNFERSRKLMGTLDPAFSALLEDLAAHKLLDSTLVVCMGEFGRTPRINGDEGRDHYPAAFSAVLAGGGVRGGQAYGATSDDGGKVTEKPLVVPHLLATVTTLLGIDPAKSLVTPIGRPIAVTEDGVPVRELMMP